MNNLDLVFYVLYQLDKKHRKFSVNYKTDVYSLDIKYYGWKGWINFKLRNKIYVKYNRRRREHIKISKYHHILSYNTIIYDIDINSRKHSRFIRPEIDDVSHFRKIIGLPLPFQTEFDSITELSDVYLELL